MEFNFYSYLIEGKVFCVLCCLVQHPDICFKGILYLSCICIHYVNFLILESDRIFTFSSYLFLRANNRLKSTTQCSLAVSWTFSSSFSLYKSLICVLFLPPVLFQLLFGCRLKSTTQCLSSRWTRWFSHHWVIFPTDQRVISICMLLIYLKPDVSSMFSLVHHPGSFLIFWMWIHISLLPFLSCCFSLVATDRSHCSLDVGWTQWFPPHQPGEWCQHQVISTVRQFVNFAPAFELLYYLVCKWSANLQTYSPPCQGLTISAFCKMSSVNRQQFTLTDVNEQANGRWFSRSGSSLQTSLPEIFGNQKHTICQWVINKAAECKKTKRLILKSNLWGLV